MNRFFSFIRLARLAEISLMLGFPFMGIVFAFDDVNALFSTDVFLFISGIFFLGTAVYSFNAWAGSDEDTLNDRLSALKTRKGKFMAATVISVILFLAIFLIAKQVLALLATISFCLWTIYSWPRIGFKYRPVLGTLIHFIGQGIHFQIGFATLKPTDLNSILISIYFSLLFSAGHINHELIDYEPDRAMRINTGAVHYGKALWEKLSFSVFTFSTLYILILTVVHSADILLFWPFIFAGVIHTGFRLMFCKNDLSTKRFLNERSFYRFLYFTAGTIFIIIKSFFI
jgi:4-hydroxybenzoate polyprenyltransferase